MSYYKTNSPDVLAAWKSIEARVKVIQSEGQIFGEYFGGKPLYQSDPVRVVGLHFSPAKPRELWTAKCVNGMQRPLANPRKGSDSETKEALKELQRDWNIRSPKTEASRDELYASLGVHWGEFLFSGGLSMFERDGWVYAETGRDMPVMQEILGSEFKRAKDAKATGELA